MLRTAARQQAPALEKPAPKASPRRLFVPSSPNPQQLSFPQWHPLVLTRSPASLAPPRPVSSRSWSPPRCDLDAPLTLRPLQRGRDRDRRRPGHRTCHRSPLRDRGRQGRRCRPRCRCVARRVGNQPEASGADARFVGAQPRRRSWSRRSRRLVDRPSLLVETSRRRTTRLSSSRRPSREFAVSSGPVQGWALTLAFLHSAFGGINHVRTLAVLSVSCTGLRLLLPCFPISFAPTPPSLDCEYFDQGD